MSATDLRALHAAAVQCFGTLLAEVADGQWRGPTPCGDWNVRALTHHVADEQQWTRPLLAGRAMAEVTPTLAEDPLGADPPAAWRALAADSTAAVAEADLRAAVHLSYGDEVAEEYVHQLVADLVVHAWDLARATGRDEQLDDGLVAGVAAWFDAKREQAWRGAGVIGPVVPIADDANAQARLLARFGRDPSSDATLAVLVRFNDAFGRRDVDGIMALLTNDCIFEDTTPPDGTRHVGQAEVRAAWEALFASSPTARFETEEGIIAGDRATYRWVYRWDDDAGPGHVRGVDVFRVRDGRVAEKCSYVKG